MNTEPEAIKTPPMPLCGSANGTLARQSNDGWLPATPDAPFLANPRWSARLESLQWKRALRWVESIGLPSALFMGPWEHLEGNKALASLSHSGPYAINHHRGYFALLYRPAGKRVPLGEFPTLEEAKAEATRHFTAALDERRAPHRTEAVAGIPPRFFDETPANTPANPTKP